MVEQGGRLEPKSRVRLSRRSALRNATIGGAGLALVAAGCGRSATSTRSTGAAGAGDKPQTGGTLRRRTTTTAFSGGFDPHVQQPSQTGEMSFFYQGLLRLNPKTLAVEQEIAQQWEQPSPTEYVFHIQPGVKWHNKPPASGRALTADDVVFSLERIRTNNPQFINRGLLDNVDKIQAVDKAKVRITTKQADATTLNNLAAFSAKMLAPEVVEKAGKFAEASS